MPRMQFIPTRAQRRLVMAASAHGVPQPEIAAMLDLRSEKTLRRHFRTELDRGGAQANFPVAQTLFRLAINGCVPALIFWMKCRAGWRERPVSEPRNAKLPPFIVSQEKPAPDPEKAPLKPQLEEPGL